MLTRDGSIAELFMELAAIPSPSGRERALGEQIRAWLAGHGVDAEFDGTGAENGSDAGNLVATIPGAPEAPTYLFVAHLDTVESGAPPVAPRLGADGVIRSAGDTILGADNKSAVAAVMSLCRAAAGDAAAAGAAAGAGAAGAGAARAGATGATALVADRRPSVVAVFTCREESGRMGASLLRPPRPVDCAFCVDGSQPIGTVITRALGQTVFTITVHGRAAHAAADPGAGVSAIAAAAEIVAGLELGRRADGGSASIAAIVGGAVIDRLSPRALAALGVGDDAGGRDSVSAALAATPTNSIPDLAALRGEVRGYSVDAMDAAVDEIAAVAARVCAARGARLEWTRDRARMIPPLGGAAGSRALALVRAAAERVPGVRFAAREAQATLEANYLAGWSDAVAVASGGRDPHQFSESITVSELTQLEALLLAILAVDPGETAVASPAV